jgi:hypothetical protein
MKTKSSLARATQCSLVLLATAAGAFAQTPPSITVQPAARAVTVGTPVTFSVTAAGSPVLAYQWRRNGIAIAGANASTYTIPVTTAADNGVLFSVVVSNGLGSILSNGALLTVNAVANVGVSGPSGVAAGETATFNANVSNGTPPFTYQWFRGEPPGGTPIAGATAASYTTPPLTTTGDQDFYVEIRDASGIVTRSSVKELFVFAGEQTITFPAPVNPVVSPTAVPLTATSSAGLPVTFAVISGGPATIVGATIVYANVGPITIRASQAGNASFNPAIPVDRTFTVGRGTPVITWATPGPVAPGTALGSGQLNAAANVPGTFSYSPPAGYQVNPPSQTLIATFTPANQTLYQVTAVTRVLTVIPPIAGARITNLSVRASLAAAQTLIVGFNVQGGAQTVLLRTIGPTLASFAVPGPMADPRLAVYRGSTLLDQNDNWGGSANLATAFAGVGAFPLAAASLDAALLRPLDGAHTAQATGGAGTVLVEVYDTGAGPSPRLTNVSARNRVGTGDDILIAGLTLAGAGERHLLIRGVGPGLAGVGVSGGLTDPKIEIYSGAVRIAENDTWAPGLAATFTSAGAFPLPASSRDAALTLRLQAGSYTVQVSGADGGTGEGLVEIYELP